MRFWKIKQAHLSLLIVLGHGACLEVVSLATQASRSRVTKSPPETRKPEQSENVSSTDLGLPTMADLQKCVTPPQLLTEIAGKIRPDGNFDAVISSTLLVRLSKQMIALDNQSQLDKEEESSSQNKSDDISSWPWENLREVISTLPEIVPTSSPSTVDNAVEATKSMAILARLCPQHVPQTIWEPLVEEWQGLSESSISLLQPQHLSGIKWSMDCFQLVGDGTSCSLSPALQEAYDSLHLPFRIRTGFLQEISDLKVDILKGQVDFQVDEIRTVSKKVVKERRQTAWEGDEGVAPFSYSGKSMPRRSWSPLVRRVRDLLEEKMGIYYDGCLLNLYPDGGSGMRYHVDPDQGVLWDYTTTVVSVGATRKFAIRRISESSGDTDQAASTKPHVFTLLRGDCTEMFGNCQQHFQHTVKTAETQNEMVPRASLVFKKQIQMNRSD